MLVSLNGRIIDASQATVSVFDRGYLMGDGVYEGLRAFGGRAHSVQRHVDRFREGLAEAKIAWDPSPLGDMTAGLLAANGLADAFVYWQVTRGVPAPGDPVRTRVPGGGLRPTVLGFCSPLPPIDHYDQPPTMAATVVADRRWTRGRLKSTSLLGNLLAAMEASDHGSREAVMIRDGLVSEACACNVILAVPAPGGTRLVTPSLDSVPILAGVTRARVLELDGTIDERPVRAAELDSAAEVILVGTTALVTAVTHLDGRRVGDGRPGPHAARLLRLFLASIRRELGIGGPAVTSPGPRAAVAC